MERKVISAIMLTLLFASMLTLAFNIQTVKAVSGTIYIRTDGSVDPLTAPIQRNGALYTLTDNIYDSIVVEIDNIVVDGAGYTVQGTESGKGIDLSNRSNVTIKNMEIKAFLYDIYLYYSSDNSIVGNNITNKWLMGIFHEGVYLYRSSDNSIVGNNITANNQNGIFLSSSSINNSLVGNNITNNYVGIWVASSRNNTISGNNVSSNVYAGIRLDYSGSNHNEISSNIVSNNDHGIHLVSPTNTNTIWGNDIANNNYGITLSGTSNNMFFHNNFVNNRLHAINLGPSVNIWDDGYPSGGNHWSDYEERYPDAEELDDSSIWDTPYVIDENNQDNYPLMEPWTPTPQPDFEISISPTNRTLTPRQSTTYTVTITSIGGFSSEVSLSSSIDPSSEDISLTFDPAAVTPPPDGSVESTFRVSTRRPVETNFYTITITGSSEDKTHSTTVTLIVAWYELFFEIDYMEGHRPTDSVLTYIQTYYIREGISVIWNISDEIPSDPVVTREEFFTYEETYNDLGDDKIVDGEVVFYSKWKWVLFGTVDENGKKGYTYTPLASPMNTEAGNYIFIADETNDDWTNVWYNRFLGVTEEEVETVVLMHEMGHSIGIIRLRDMDEVYDRSLTSVMSWLSPLNCNAVPIHYSNAYWHLKDMGYYRV